MKYIRTENGIYDLKNDNKERIFSLYSYNEYSEKEFKNLILKQADTIEELVDDMVVDCKINNAHIIKDYYDLIEDYYYGALHETDVVYGAIWTDKGLIYVAKMNEKGELELI